MGRDGRTIFGEPVAGRIAAAAPLRVTTQPGVALCVRCPQCNALALFDAASWVARGLGGVRLGRLQAKLRCLCCGGRQGAFEVWNPRALPPGMRRWSAAQLPE